MHAVEKEKILTNSKVVFYMHLQLIKDKFTVWLFVTHRGEQCHDSVGGLLS